MPPAPADSPTRAQGPAPEARHNLIKGGPPLGVGVAAVPHERHILVIAVEGAAGQLVPRRRRQGVGALLAHQHNDLLALGGTGDQGLWWWWCVVVCGGWGGWGAVVWGARGAQQACNMAQAALPTIYTAAPQCDKQQAASARQERGVCGDPDALPGTRSCPQREAAAGVQKEEEGALVADVAAAEREIIVCLLAQWAVQLPGPATDLATGTITSYTNQPTALTVPSPPCLTTCHAMSSHSTCAKGRGVWGSQVESSRLRCRPSLLRAQELIRHRFGEQLSAADLIGPPTHTHSRTHP